MRLNSTTKLKLDLKLKSNSKLTLKLKINLKLNSNLKTNVMGDIWFVWDTDKGKGRRSEDASSLPSPTNNERHQYALIFLLVNRLALKEGHEGTTIIRRLWRWSMKEDDMDKPLTKKTIGGTWEKMCDEELRTWEC